MLFVAQTRTTLRETMHFYSVTLPEPPGRQSTRVFPIGWGFGSHHLIVLPHAFRGANAYYSPRDHALLFGYFTGATGKTVYTCLSHDVIVHETTHALLHGLRERFSDPSSPDQAAFHEGFADVVALLSVFSLPEVAAVILDYTS